MDDGSESQDGQVPNPNPNPNQSPDYPSQVRRDYPDGRERQNGARRDRQNGRSRSNNGRTVNPRSRRNRNDDYNDYREYSESHGPYEYERPSQEPYYYGEPGHMYYGGGGSNNHHYENSSREYYRPFMVPFPWPMQQQQSSNPHGKEKHNMDSSEKVSVNLGAGGLGGYGGHSDSSSNAALLALLAMGRDNRGCSDGFGGGGLGALAALAVLGGGFGGFGRGHDGVHVDCGRRGGRDGYDGDPFVLSKLGSIEGAVPLAASQIQNGILESTAGITNTINQTGLAQLAATSGVKDAVMNSATAILQNASANTQSVLGAICNLSSKIDQNTILDLQRQLGVAEADACEERNSRRTREVEINVTQQVNQQQAQLQLQRIEDDRFNRLFANLSAFIGNQAMFARQGQDVINFGGTMTASGTQAAANTQVR